MVRKTKKYKWSVHQGSPPDREHPGVVGDVLERELNALQDKHLEIFAVVSFDGDLQIVCRKEITVLMDSEK